MKTSTKMTTTLLAKRQWHTFTIMTLNISRLIDGNKNICITGNLLRSPYFHFSGNGRLLQCGRRMSAPRKSLRVEILYKKICSLLMPYVFTLHILKEVLSKQVWFYYSICTNCPWNRIFWKNSKILSCLVT